MGSRRVPKFCKGSLVTKILGFQKRKRKIRDPPYPPHFWADKGCIYISCPRVLKLWIWLLRGLGICLKMTHVDGGPSGGSSVCRPGSEDPHRRQRNSICFQKVAKPPGNVIQIGLKWANILLFVWRHKYDVNCIQPAPIVETCLTSVSFVKPCQNLTWGIL